MCYRGPFLAVAACVAGACLAGLTLRAADKPDQPAGKTYDSPQAVFDAAQAAQDKDDYKSFVNCLSPEDQKQMASRLAFLGMVQQPAAQTDEKLRDQFKNVLAVMDKHGLGYDVTQKIKPEKTPEGAAKAQREVGALIKDPAAFDADMMEALSKTEPFTHKPPAGQVVPKLTDVKIDGDKATGTVVVTLNGMDRKSPIEFVKVDGGWKLAPPPEPPPTAPAPTPPRDK